METLDGFVKTALRPRSVDGEQRWDYYYSRPAEITGSYEARRYIAPRRPDVTAPDGERTERIQGEVEIYEYHWSFLMTGNRFADVLPKTLRLFLRRPSNVPDSLFGIWRVVWIVILAILLTVPALFVVGYLLDTDVPRWIVGLVGSAVILLFWFGMIRLLGKLLVNKVTSHFVDVARYLDTSPHSYAARRAIRGGLVDLLHALHDGRYSRIVVVAHSLGAYISYDALTSLWAQTHELHAGPPNGPRMPRPIRLKSLDGLEKAADRLIADSGADGALDDFQDLQFALWQDLRRQGNPWRITDFVTVGTPMALALVGHPPRTLRWIQDVRPGATPRTDGRTGSSGRPGPLSTAQRDAARRERRAAAPGELSMAPQRSAPGARIPIPFRGHALDEPLVSGDSRRAARRLVRRSTAPAVRSGHPRHRSVGQQVRTVQTRIGAHRILCPSRQGRRGRRGLSHSQDAGPADQCRPGASVGRTASLPT